MGPKLSIVVPVYNTEKYLRFLLECLVHQTYQDKEVILVDDGSTDSSPTICDEYSEKYSFFHVIHKKNEGVQIARNKGLEDSKGEYISFIDSDDWIDFDFYEQLMNAAYRTESDFAACGFRTEYAKKETVKTENEKSDPVIINGREACLRAVGGDDVDIAGFVWNKVFKKSLIGNSRFRPDVPICDDMCFTYEVIDKAKRGCYVAADMYHYRYVSGGLSKNASMDRYLNCLKKIKELCDSMEEKAPYCLDSLYRSYIFWNTKSCENMLNSFDYEAYRTIQKNLMGCETYIDKCSFRIRLLAKKIIKSWKIYRIWGLFFWRLKKMYIKLENLKKRK